MYTLSKSWSSDCPSPTEILLILDVYLVLSCITSLILGVKPIRSSLSYKHLISADANTLPSRYLPWISIAGGLAIHFSGTILTAHILTSSDHAVTTTVTTSTASKLSPLARMFFLWLSRPLATGPIFWLSIVNRKAYRDNAREVAIVDGLYSSANVYLFYCVAKITNVKPSRVPAWARLARAASALWLLAFVLSAFALIGHYASDPPDDGDGPDGSTSKRRFSSPWIWFSLDALRFLACWLLWAGLLFTDETAFCPTRKTLALVTCVWLVVPVMDCLWRGFVSFTPVQGEPTGAEEAERLIDM